MNMQQISNDTEATITDEIADCAVYCVDERWDNGGLPYANPEDFLAMCRECFGTTPTLTETASGDYRDDDGTTILISACADCDEKGEGNYCTTHEGEWCEVCEDWMRPDPRSSAGACRHDPTNQPGLVPDRRMR